MKLDLNLDLFKDFALDVWEDLGRTRLAGVAVGLCLALLGITAVVLQPGGASDVAASSPVAAMVPSEESVAFSVPSDDPTRMSDLELSSPRDPFESLDPVSDQTLLAAGNEVIDSVMGFDSTAGTSSTTTGGATSLMPLDDLSGTPATPTAPAPTGDPHADFDGTDDEPAAPATDYAYTADIQFGEVDDLKRYATVQRLGLVPSRQMPLIMFLGASTDHETAVFMVDSRLSQGGEGECVPRDSLCTFLELRADSAHDEHHFRDADGNEYVLRLRGLTRTSASSGSMTGRDVSALKGTPPVVDGQR